VCWGQVRGRKSGGGCHRGNQHQACLGWRVAQTIWHGGLVLALVLCAYLSRSAVLFGTPMTVGRMLSGVQFAAS
jgi:hypothetical protein